MFGGCKFRDYKVLQADYSVAPLRMSTRSYSQLRVVGFRLEGCGIHILIGCIQISLKGIEQDKTLQLFMLNNKRLGGYTQWVRFSESAHH
jgi:hypothetical protein